MRLYRLNNWLFAVFGYFLISNILLFLMMAYDKSQAKKKKQRIPEKRMLLLGLLGGGFGGYFAMKLFHHKTLHWYFKWCYGANILLWVLAFLIYIWK